MDTYQIKEVIFTMINYIFKISLSVCQLAVWMQLSGCSLLSSDCNKSFSDFSINIICGKILFYFVNK